MAKNQIIIDGITYNLISDKAGKQNCHLCDLKDICQEKLDINSNSWLCNIFNTDIDLNGYFVKEKEDV